MHARGCFQYQRYNECIASVNRIVHQIENGKLSLSVVNEAKLLKGKSLFFSYQNKQQIYLRRRALDSIKEVEALKHECYEKAREAILLLGTAEDYSFLDEEGSRLLDSAMIDYLRETNNLNSCQRCLLCRRKSKLRRSHVFPKCILKDIAKDLSSREDDHKVFCSMIGKVVKKKSAGEVTFGMLCSQCEQCLCQNGEEQFFEQIHSKICVKREVIEAQLKLPYGSWLYDFCIGVLFRSFAISDNKFNFSGAGEDLYEIFSNCRKHLLSLTMNMKQGGQKQKETAEPFGSASLCPLQIFFFVNPTINASSCPKLKNIPKTPAFLTSPISLDKGIYSHEKQPFIILIHFDCMNILVQLQTTPLPTIQDGKISPCGGELKIPEEHERWQVIPTGVWKLYSAIVQASENVSIKSLKQDAEHNVYYPENIINLKHLAVFSLLPPNYMLSLSDNADKEISIQLPKDHQVLLRVSRQWGHEQEMVYIVAEGCDNMLYLIFILSVPGWHIVDGLHLDVFNFGIMLPFLDGKNQENHPLKISVLEALVEQVPKIKQYLYIKRQLS